jgi:hypothetical protein
MRSSPPSSPATPPAVVDFNVVDDESDEDDNASG